MLDRFIDGSVAVRSRRTFTAHRVRSSVSVLQRGGRGAGSRGHQMARGVHEPESVGIVGGGGGGSGRHRANELRIAIDSSRARCRRRRITRVAFDSSCAASRIGKRIAAGRAARGAGDGFSAGSARSCGNGARLKTGSRVAALVPLDHRIRAVIVDRLEVLGFEHIRDDAFIGVQARRDIPHEILDELRVLIRALGHELLVGALQQAPQFARRLFLRDANEFLDRDFARDCAAIVTCER